MPFQKLALSACSLFLIVSIFAPPAKGLIIIGQNTVTAGHDGYVHTGWDEHTRYAKKENWNLRLITDPDGGVTDLTLERQKIGNIIARPGGYGPYKAKIGEFIESFSVLRLGDVTTTSISGGYPFAISAAKSQELGIAQVEVLYDGNSKPQIRLTKNGRLMNLGGLLGAISFEGRAIQEPAKTNLVQQTGRGSRQCAALFRSN